MLKSILKLFKLKPKYSYIEVLDWETEKLVSRIDITDKSNIEKEVIQRIINQNIPENQYSRAFDSSLKLKGTLMP